MLKKVIGILFLLSLVSCAIGPLNGPESARPLGEGNWQVSTGLSHVPYLTVSRGITEKFDLGIGLEVQSSILASLNAKYSFVDGGVEGFSAAMAASGFQAVNSKGFYIGPVFSYRKNWFETYLFSRFNYVKWKLYKLDSDEKDDIFFDFFNYGENLDVPYIQNTIGFNFWFSETFAFGIDAKFVTPLKTDDIDGSDTAVVPGINFIFRI